MIFQKKNFFKKIQEMNLIDCTDANFSESRDIKGNLNFLRSNQKINEIKDCQIINLESNKNKLIKVKDLF